MAVTGWIITMFAEMFGVELAAIVEASKEETAKAEDKKAEKTSLEATKEVHKDIEIKVDKREKPAVPVSLFDASSGSVRSTPLNKQEQNLLPDSLKIPMDLSHKQVMNNEDSKVQKPKVNGEKKVEQPKKDGRTTAPKTATGKGQVQNRRVQGCNSDKKKKIEQDNNNTYQASSQSAKNNKDASDTQGAVLNSQPIPKPVSNKGTSGQFVKSSVADCGFDFNIGTWNGAENEPKQSSVNDAQENPKSKFTDVLNERTARGNGNTPSR